MSRFNEKPDTLCWSCHNACGRCAWSAFGIPVEGWTATETSVKGDRGPFRTKSIQSYIVRECPRFKEDEPLRAERITDDGFKHLLYAMLNDLVWDYASAYIKFQAEMDRDKRIRPEQVMKEIESYVSKPIFDDIVDVLELMVDGPKLLELIRRDPHGVIDRLNANPKNARGEQKEKYKKSKYRKEQNYAD